MWGAYDGAASARSESATWAMSTWRHARPSPCCPPGEGRGIGHRESIALDTDQAIRDQAAQELVHALAGASDHRRKVRLRIRPVECDLPVGRWRRLLAQLHEAPRQPARQVQEMELLHVAGEASQLRDQGCQEGVAQL